MSRGGYLGHEGKTRHARVAMGAGWSARTVSRPAAESAAARPWRERPARVELWLICRHNSPRWCPTQAAPNLAGRARPLPRSRTPGGTVEADGSHEVRHVACRAA